MIYKNSITSHQSRVKGLKSYMDELVFYEPHLKPIVELSMEVLRGLTEVMGILNLTLAVPNACPGENNNFMFVWDSNLHYLECEVFINGVVEFFYKDRTSGFVWGLDLPGDEDNLHELMARLLMFCSHGRKE